MARENLHTTMLGFAVTVIVFAVLFYFAGVGKLVDQVTMAGPTCLIATLAITLVWFVAWGASLETVLGVLGANVSTARLFLIFMGATFSDNITPFEQADDGSVTALLVSWSTDTEYGAGLTAITGVDTINFVPSITIALIDAGYYATEVTFGRNLEIALIAVITLAIGVPAAIYTAWRRHYGLEHRLIGALTSFIRTITQYVPRASVPTNDGIERRINGFFRSIERVGRNPRGLAIALGLSGLDWFYQMVALWVVFHVIGVPIAFSITLFVVSIEVVAGMTPLPGDAGGIEWTLAILITTAGSAVSFDVATAGIVVFREFVYWVPVVLGGLAMGTESARGWRS